MTKKFFITGTDTHVGKTYISVALLKAFRKKGFTTLGIKPIASGCIHNNGKLYSEDALALQEASSIALPYEKINPFAFLEPIAPHIAAKKASVELNIRLVKEKCFEAINFPADVCIVEGAGGWLLPLNDQELLSDFVLEMGFKIILVVGIRLGCINHALLTYEVMKNNNANLVGWVANIMDPNLISKDQVITSLRARLKVPCLGVINDQEKAEDKLLLDYLF